MSYPAALLLLLMALAAHPSFLNAEEGKKKKKKAAPAATAPGPASDTPPVQGGMVFASNWLPETLTARRELLESMEFYSRASIRHAKENGKGQKFIVGDIRWRMPYEEAVLTLPKGCNKLSERTLVHTCLPNSSLTLCGFQFKSFMDRGQPFNLLFLVLDKERKVVSVEFVNQTGNDTRWFPKPDGVREPYYNMLNLTFNGSTGKEVPYQLLGGARRALCVKTAFKDKPIDGKVYENVHWYLPAPLAHAILDIVQVYRKSGIVR